MEKSKYASGKAFDDPKGKPHYDGNKRAPDGHRLTTNALPPKGQKPFDNEVYIDRDIIVLANPEIANLPNWVIALIAAACFGTALINGCWITFSDIIINLSKIYWGKFY